MGQIAGKVFGDNGGKSTVQTKFSAGLAGMTLFRSIPVITYWRQFAPPKKTSEKTSLPSQFCLRY